MVLKIMKLIIKRCNRIISLQQFLGTGLAGSRKTFDGESVLLPGKVTGELGCGIEVGECYVSSVATCRKGPGEGCCAVVTPYCHAVER